jgi:malate dehydrogenase
MASMSTALHATTAANGIRGSVACASSCRSVSLGFAAASGLRGLRLSSAGCGGRLSLLSDGAMRGMPVQVRADSSAGAAAAAAPKPGLSTFKVAVLGAAGGIGQPLSLLIKMSPLVGELRLYDIANVKGVAADLSHCNTPAQVSAYTGPSELAAALKDVDLVIIPAGVPRKPGMTRDDLFNINAGIVRSLIEAVADNAPGALINIISNPVNSTVPIAAEVLKAKGVYDPKKVFGVTTLDVVRANTFVAQKKNLRLIDVNVPVIGGHAGVTILPLLSKTKPTVEFTPEEVDELTVRIQNAGTEVVEAKAGAGSATLSMAYAAARFAESCMRALDGDSDVYECAYVQSEVTDLPFFATTVKLGKKGVEEIIGEDLDGITEYEKKAVDALKSELKGSIEKGVQFAQKQAAAV